MSRIEELRKDVANRISVEKAYWDNLGDIAMSFGYEFGDFLGLDGKRLLDQNGQVMPFMRFGRVKDGEFESCAPWKYDRDGLKLKFQFLLSLPGTQGDQSEITIGYKISISKPDVYSSSVQFEMGKREQVTTCEIVEGKVEMQPFLERLYADIREKLDPRSI